MQRFPEKATRQHTRDHNSRLVLQTIYDAGQISRADLARKTLLTRTTVSDVVSGLIEQGLVEERGLGTSGGGRTPTLISIVDDSRVAIAVSITATELQGAVVNLRGGIQQRTRMQLGTASGDAILPQLNPFIDQVVHSANRPLLGIGISMPGLVDTADGIVRHAVNFGWRNVPLRSLLQHRYNVPVYVANDSHTVALAEYMFGRARQADSLVAIKVGQGIGAGIVLNGRLFTGDEYGAGEIGHLRVEEHGLPCKCGNAGCLETVASVQAIVHRAQLLAQHDPHSPLHRFVPEGGAITLETVLEAFLADDPGVQQIIVAIGRYLAIGIASFIAVLGVHNIVITGRIAPFGQMLADAVRQEIRRRVLPELAQATNIEIITQGADSVLLGTAVLLLTNELGLTRLFQRQPQTDEIAA